MGENWRHCRPIGMLEKWNSGIMGLVTFLRAGFPLFQHSIIPKHDFFRTFVVEN
jgi:hypothetical protein